MAVITAQASTANAALTYVAASAGGDTIAVGSSQRTTLLVRNASGAAITVTFAAVSSCSQGFLHNVVASCSVGDTEIAVPAAAIGSGSAAITYSASASVTVAAIKD